MIRKKALAVSIVIPVYNEEHYIKACLDSIADQTTKPLEVLVIDNNCTDSTVAIASKYKFVTVLTEPIQGVQFARDRGFNAARGDVIGRIDADTVLTPEWVKTCQAIFSRPVDAATGPVFFYDMPLSPKNLWLDHGFKAFISGMANQSLFLFGTNMAVRRQAWETVREATCRRRDILEDLDLAIHLRDSGLKSIYTKELQAGMSSRRYDDKFRNFFAYMRQFRNTYQCHNIAFAGSTVAQFGYLLGYFALYPLRRSYDIEKKSRSIKRLVGTRNTARKNPMH